VQAGANSYLTPAGTQVSLYKFVLGYSNVLIVCVSFAYFHAYMCVFVFGCGLIFQGFAPHFDDVDIFVLQVCWNVF
jgi:hypothetical protein